MEMTYLGLEAEACVDVLPKNHSCFFLLPLCSKTLSLRKFHMGANGSMCVRFEIFFPPIILSTNFPSQSHSASSKPSS